MTPDQERKLAEQKRMGLLTQSIHSQAQSAAEAQFITPPATILIVAHGEDISYSTSADSIQTMRILVNLTNNLGVRLQEAQARKAAEEKALREEN